MTIDHVFSVFSHLPVAITLAIRLPLLKSNTD